MTMILCQTEGCRICESIGGRPSPRQEREAAPAPMPISSERDRADAQKYNSPDNKTIVKAKYIW